MAEVYHGGIPSFVLSILVITFLKTQKWNSKNWPLLLSDLLIRFFEFYSCHLNYKLFGISILNNFSFFFRSDWGWTPKQKHPTLCIESPFNPEQDLCEPMHHFSEILKAFENGLEVIKFYPHWKCIIDSLIPEYNF